jgi:hypothetical protein
MTLRHLVGALIVLSGIGWSVFGQAAPDAESVRPASAPDDARAEPPEPLRLREGSRFTDEVGEFRETGGRIAFFADGTGASMVVLENLALERVSRDMEQGKRKWSVSGKVTEFRGSNYLILERVVLKSRSSADTIVPRS